MIESEVFKVLEEKILEIQNRKNKVVRVGINGIEGTGKTVFCNNLILFLRKNGLDAIHVSIEGYHNTKELRYKQGRNSAKGYYEDGYCEIEFIEKVLKSCQSENPKYVEAIHNLETDEILKLQPRNITNKSIIVTDGAYLFKDVYSDFWDLKIYLKTDFLTASIRRINRDLIQLGGLKSTKEKYDNRYHLASKMYNEENNPMEKADVIIDNTNLEDLVIVKE